MRLTRILDKLGIRVPGDMSMAGFGYHPQEENITNFDRYVTIVEPWNKIGLLAGQTIMSYAAQKSRYMPSLTLAPSRIVPGNSVQRLQKPAAVYA
jgi:DNA-binding LacI/PurR family transcriptional regulator